VRAILPTNRDCKVGHARQFPDATGYYAPFQVTGVGSVNVRYAGGIDAIQAIQLAMKMIGAYLSMLTNEGGDLSWEGGDNGISFPILRSLSDDSVSRRSRSHSALAGFTEDKMLFVR